MEMEHQLGSNATTNSCANCGIAGGVSLKTCKSCMLVSYCNATCQLHHWAAHKAVCKQRAAELRDMALFKDPPRKEDCPICFLPMPIDLICCVSLPPATISSVPIHDFAKANAGLEDEDMEMYYPCCGKSVCGGCMHSFHGSGTNVKCPFCNSDRGSKTDEEDNADFMKQVEANDPGAIYVLGSSYYHGNRGVLRDREKAIELWKQAAELGSSRAHFQLGVHFEKGEDWKKAKLHYEVAAMAGHELARYNLGYIDFLSGKKERASKHMKLAASAGVYRAMNNLLVVDFKQDLISRDEIDSILTAYNDSCAEMRSEARDAYILMKQETLISDLLLSALLR